MKKDWTYKKFEDCIENVKYTTKIQSKDYMASGEYPIISQEEELVSGYWNKNEDVFSASRPLVVFGDHTRVLKYIDFDFVLGADGVKILLPVEDLEAKFLYYFLKWYNVPSLGYSRHYKLLKELSIPIPPLSIQRSIVDELDLLHSVISKKKEQLRELDNLAQAIFYQMFGDPITNPMGWEVKKLGEVASKIGSGATPKGGNESYKDEGISLIRSLNVYNNFFTYKDLAHIDDVQANELKNVIVCANDILLNITGASVARCCIVPNDVLPARVNQHVAIIRLNNDISHVFMHRQLTSIEYQEKLLLISRGSGATREALTKGQLEQLTIILPPLSLQQSFAAKVSAIETQKQAITQSIQHTEALLAQRMDNYFGI